MTKPTGPRNKARGYESEARARALYRQLYPSTERSGSATGYRIKGASDLVGLPFHVQVKRRVSTWIGRLYAEAKRAAPESKIHIVTQDDRGELLVTMPLTQYITDIRTALGEELP